MMSVASGDTHNQNKALYRYARDFYLKHYRLHRFGAGHGDYITQALLSALAAGYAGVQTYKQWQGKSELGIFIGLVATFLLAWSTLYGLGKLVELHLQANAFADEALLCANTEAEVEQYFDDTFPWVFYHKF